MSATVFQNCTLLDCTGADPAPRSTVVVEGDRITSVGRGQQPAPPVDSTLIDCDGRTLMPGLTDAHIHAAIIETDMSKARAAAACRNSGGAWRRCSLPAFSQGATSRLGPIVGRLRTEVFRCHSHPGAEAEHKEHLHGPREDSGLIALHPTLFGQSRGGDKTEASFFLPSCLFRAPQSARADCTQRLGQRKERPLAPHFTQLSPPSLHQIGQAV